MLLAYVDESFTDGRYYIAALIVPDAVARDLSVALDKIVDDVAWDFSGLDHHAELHAYDLVGGKRAWEPLADKLRVRIGVYHKAIQAITDHGATVILRGVDKKRLAERYAMPDHPHAVVLGHLVERLDEYAERRGENALVIADEVPEQDAYRRDLWHSQRYATRGYRARQIKRVVDTIHFAPSHASRLLQGADLVAYLLRRRATHTETDRRSAMVWAALYDGIDPRIWHSQCWYP